MKKGFTLIELLAVISILALIAVVVFPAINSTIQNSREKAYKDQVKLIEKAAEEWALDPNNMDTLETTDGFETTVSISALVSGGYIAEDEVLNPKDDTEMQGVVEVTYNGEYNQFEFDYVESKEWQLVVNRKKI